MTLDAWPNWCVDWYREVNVKSEDSQKIRAILVARSRLVAIRRDIENQVRSLIKEYGLLFRCAIGKQFRNQVSELLGEDHQPLGVIAPLFSIHEHICEQQSEFDDCFGPSQAPKSRPFENASPAPIAATIALEMIGPMPGTVISHSQPFFLTSQRLDLAGEGLNAAPVCRQVFEDVQHVGQQSIGSRRQDDR